MTLASPRQPEEDHLVKFGRHTVPEHVVGGLVEVDDHISASHRPLREHKVAPVGLVGGEGRHVMIPYCRGYGLPQCR